MKLADIRNERGLSQRQLSEKSGVSIRMIQHYEQGFKDINKASAETIYRLAKSLNCKMEDLVMEKEFRAMTDLGYHEEPAWYQKVGGEIVIHSDANFYGIYGNDVDGWELAYWGEDMKEPWTGNMYYDEECTEPVDIEMIEK